MPRSSALLVVLAALAVSAGCASTGAVPAPFPVPGGAAPNPPAGTSGGSLRSRGSNATGYAIAGAALSFRGTPYKNGGADPSGFDCSGLVAYVFQQNGIALPRTVSEQYRVGRTVAPADVQPGDLVFFSTVSPGASHVGIAIGGDEFVHAPNSRGEVRVEHLSATYWASRFVGARRDW